MSSKIKLVVGVLLVVVLVVVAISLLTGGDGDDDGPEAQKSGQGGGGDDGDDAGASGGASALRTVATKRGEGKYATALPSANMRKPKEIWLRVSAAPKQEVTGTWNVSCGAGNVAQDTFTVTPPHLQKLEIPGKNVRSCIAGASAQLSGEGRLKVAILRDR